ncbi:two-component regulator propeller domain-containing protein [Flaviramulus aquimarinus]|uniref:Two-component regulator propeller domain-containing protein n=1 Tax=Flaviramulus aquimarinus TaxID=1170456 RepID=A0ABP9EWG0_9FLAO
MRYFYFLFFFLITNGLNAQTIKPVDTLNSNYFGQKQGLLQLNIKGMALDDLGYLWVGTEDGLHKFNGYEFKAYLHNPNDTTSIKDDHIRSLLFTKDTLWAATNTNGITNFIPSKNTFSNLSLNSKDVNTSYKVLKLGKQHLLFSVKNNIIIYDRHTKKTKLIELPISKKESYVTDVYQKEDNTYWLATTASGILELNINSFKISSTTILNNENIKCFFYDNEHLYIGTNNGLFLYDSKKKSITKTTLTTPINCFFKINNSTFYIGTNTGLYLYDKAEFSITSLVLKTNKLNQIIDINEIIGDKKGNLWFGTDGSGLFYHNSFQKKFNTLKIKLKEYPSISNISSFRFLKGKDSTLWIGSKYGILKYNHNTNAFKLYHKAEPALIYTIAKDQNNTIWTGGFTSGLLKYDEKRDVFNKISNSKNNLPDEDVIEIIPIDSNTLWISTWSGGMYTFNIKKETFKPLTFNKQIINRARISLKDSKGHIWLGTDEGAYKVSKDHSLTRYHAEDIDNKKLSGNRIFSIIEDLNGDIWFGTNVGLTKLNLENNQTTIYRKQEGLPNDFIYGMLISNNNNNNNNNVWVSSNYGLSMLNTKTNSFKNYTTNDGLQNIEFNGKAAYKDLDGNFYFGGISGINIFKPEDIVENPHVPNTYIESVELFNKPILKNELFKDTLTFNSNENVITFNFASLNYLNPEKCDYSYKMEGFDTDWRPATKNRRTTYTNLDPGNYIFKVKASNDVGVWNNIPDTLSIIIIPPWYQTNAFRFFAVFLIIIIPFLYNIYKTKKLKTDKLKLEKIIKERTIEIRDKNKALKDAFNQAEKQSNNIQFLMRELTHRVKNNLQIISSLLNIQANSLKNESAIDAIKMAKNRILTISHLEDKISIKKDSVELDIFIKSLCDNVIKALSDDEHLKFKINYDLTKTAIKNLNITMIGLILNELITNTTKYAFDDFKPENELNITSSIHKKKLRIVISDNGKGYSKTKVKHDKSLGIELVSEMVEQLNGTIRINSTNGTRNVIDIPL